MNPEKSVDRNIRAYFGLLEKVPGFDVRHKPGLFRVISAVRYSFFNSFFPLEPEDATGIIREARSLALSRGVPILWWTGPGAGEAGREDLLASHGFSHLENLSGMSLECRDLSIPAETAPGFSCARVRDASALARWCEIAAGNFGMTDAAAEALKAHVSSQGFGPGGRLDNYLGFLDRRPVATATVFYERDEAGIYNVSTLPRARGRGVGTSLTRAVLDAARKRGAARIVLQATAAGAGIYDRLGFRRVSRIGNFEFDGRR